MRRSVMRRSRDEPRGTCSHRGLGHRGLESHLAPPSELALQRLQGAGSPGERPAELVEGSEQVVDGGDDNRLWRSNSVWRSNRLRGSGRFGRFGRGRRPAARALVERRDVGGGPRLAPEKTAQREDHEAGLVLCPGEES